MAKVYNNGLIVVILFILTTSFAIIQCNPSKLKRDTELYNIESYDPTIDVVILRTKRQLSSTQSTGILQQPIIIKNKNDTYHNDEISTDKSNVKPPPDPFIVDKSDTPDEEKIPILPSSSSSSSTQSPPSPPQRNNAKKPTGSLGEQILLGGIAAKSLDISPISTTSPSSSSSGIQPQLSSSSETTGVQSSQQSQQPAEAAAAAAAPPPPPPRVSNPINPQNFNRSQFDFGEHVVDSIDTYNNETEEDYAKHNLTLLTIKDFQYYNTTTKIDVDKSNENFKKLQAMTINNGLSQSYRRAITVQLSFDFPFYGHPIRNITVATGGFLYTGDYVHSWLAATQYIAPLMANFDSSIDKNSHVRFHDDGTTFSVLWENVALQDKPDVGSFTFSVQLSSSGAISFNYFVIPIGVDKILDDKHPVKIGLSDAYIIDKTIVFARRKTIYEYHRVNFDNQEISNSTIITMIANPTCLSYHDCASCIDNEHKVFQCTWCPALNKCSTGTDRGRQDWLQKGCDRSQLSDSKECPAIGSRGNNYNSEQSYEVKTTPNNGADDDVSTPHWSVKNGSALANSSSNRRSMKPLNSNEFESDHQGMNESNGSMTTILGLFIPICLIMCLVVWIFYAYRNPHTKSGQLLIQYRPSQWGWKRGEARYTAATIHM